MQKVENIFLGLGVILAGYMGIAVVAVLFSR